MSSHEVCDSARPQLRLFSGAHENGDAPLGWTLWDVWEELLLPDLRRRDRSPETIGEYRTALRQLDEWLLREGAQYGMANPVLRDVSRATLEQFRGWLVSRPLSPRTANKRIAALQRIMQTAAEREECPYDGAVRVPRLEAGGGGSKLYLRSEQVERLYRAAQVCAWPRADRRGRPLDPVAQWRAAIVLWWTYGPRTQELVRYERRMRAICWGNLHPAGESPADDGQAVCEHGWLAYVPQKQQRLKPGPLVLPLSALAAAHLRAIRPPAIRPEQPVCDWPMASGRLYEQWERLTEAAGVRPKPDPATGQARRFHLKHFRKSCETHYATHYGEDLARAIVGHAPRDVALRHYIHLEQRILRAVLESPAPAAFAEIFQAGDVQLRLF